MLKNLKKTIIFWYILEEKDLTYQVTTENEPKFKFLALKWNKIKNIENWKSAWILAKIFEVHHQIYHFLARNSQKFKKV